METDAWLMEGCSNSVKKKMKKKVKMLIALGEDSYCCILRIQDKNEVTPAPPSLCPTKGSGRESTGLVEKPSSR